MEEWTDFAGGPEGTCGNAVGEVARCALGRVQIIDKLLSQVRSALTSPECTRNRPGSKCPAMPTQEEYAKLQEQLAALQSRLAESDTNPRSLEELEADLAQAVERLMAGAANEDEIDKLDAAIKGHPAHAARLEKQNREWEEREYQANREAFEAQRSVIPLRVSEMSLVELERALATKCLAKRVFACRVLWLVWAADIGKAHPSDLHNRYNTSGCDIIELRAAYYAVKDLQFHNDTDGRKQLWREQLRAKLVDMVSRLDKLTPNERRRPEYNATADHARVKADHKPTRVGKRTAKAASDDLFAAIRQKHTARLLSRAVS